MPFFQQEILTLSPMIPSFSMMATKRCKHDSLHRLLPELIFDIFSRVRIRDLSQCRFVCKGWKQYLCHLIYDPAFINLHHCRRNQQDPDHLFLCNSRDTSSKLYLVDHDSNNHSTSLKARQCCNKTPNHQLQIVGSSNGLLCLALPPIFHKYPGLYERIYICNPVTGDTLELPTESNLEAIAESESTQSYKATSCGFAYDSTANAYKVIRTRCYDSKRAPPRDRTAVEMYTLGSGRSWRRIDDIPTSIFKHGRQFQVFLNGALHWFTYYRGQFAKCIGAMNIIDEQLKAFKIPLWPYGIKTNLCSLEDHLCMIYEALPDMVIWVMTEYGVETSWKQNYKIKVETLPWRVLYSNGLEDRWVLPLSVMIERKMSDGNVLIHAEGNIYYCDFENQQYKTLQINNITDCLGDKYFRDLVAHVGSLISPTNIDQSHLPSEARNSFLLE